MRFRYDRHVDITDGDRVAFQWRRRSWEPEQTWTGVVAGRWFRDGVCVSYRVYVDAPQNGIDRATLDDGGRRRCFVELDAASCRLVERGTNGRALEVAP